MVHAVYAIRWGAESGSNILQIVSQNLPLHPCMGGIIHVKLLYIICHMNLRTIWCHLLLGLRNKVSPILNCQRTGIENVSGEQGKVHKGSWTHHRIDKYPSQRLWAENSTQSELILLGGLPKFTFRLSGARTETPRNPQQPRHPPSPSTCSVHTGCHSASCEWPVTTTASAGNQRNGITAIPVAQEVRGSRDLGVQSNLVAGTRRTGSTALQAQASLPEWRTQLWPSNPFAMQCISSSATCSYVMQKTRSGIKIYRQKDTGPF